MPPVTVEDYCPDEDNESITTASDPDSDTEDDDDDDYNPEGDDGSESEESDMEVEFPPEIHEDVVEEDPEHHGQHERTARLRSGLSDDPEALKQKLSRFSVACHRRELTLRSFWTP